MNRALNIPVEERAIVDAFPYIQDACIATQDHLDKGFLRVLGGLGGGTLALAIESGVQEATRSFTHGSILPEVVFSGTEIGTAVGAAYIFGSGIKRMFESAIAVRRISRGTALAKQRW